jgi:L-threonylcarbamoyladenylate synthase
MYRRPPKTRVLPADGGGLAAAAAILQAGGLVAFPTETVYGLGAHALDAHAVEGIFVAKGRPADDPVIVHLADASLVAHVAELNAPANRLGDAFWPGPLTLVLPKLPSVPSEVTAGLDSVGVRVPSHPVALGLLRESGLPVAAPSANLFGRPSPTTAAHVLDDLDGRIDAVVDGGPTSVGLESTIVDLTAWPPRLLRPGGVAAEAIEAVLGTRLAAPGSTRAGPQPAPGMLAAHYAPRTPLTLVTGPLARERLFEEVRAAMAHRQRVGVLALEEDAGTLPQTVRREVVGSWEAPEKSAARLYDALRALDASGADVLIARDLAEPTVGIGRALSDRLRRAARRVLDSHP